MRSILSIGDAFGLTTVAEGVETAEQLERARRARLRPRAGLPTSAGRRLPGEIDGMLEVTRMARTNRWRMTADLLGKARRTGLDDWDTRQTGTAEFSASVRDVDSCSQSELPTLREQLGHWLDARRSGRSRRFTRSS